MRQLRRTGKHFASIAVLMLKFCVNCGVQVNILSQLRFDVNNLWHTGDILLWSFLSIFLSIHQSIHLSIYQSICLSRLPWTRCWRAGRRADTSSSWARGTPGPSARQTRPSSGSTKTITISGTDMFLSIQSSDYCQQEWYR